MPSRHHPNVHHRIHSLQGPPLDPHSNLDCRTLVQSEWMLKGLTSVERTYLQLSSKNSTLSLRLVWEMVVGPVLGSYGNWFLG